MTVFIVCCFLNNDSTQEDFMLGGVQEDYNPDKIFGGVQLLKQQQDVVDIIKDKKELLIFHGIGSGKSCTMIAAGAKLQCRVLVLMPASVIPNFKKEFGVCCGYFDEYEMDCDGSSFKIMSYNKFNNMAKKPSCDILMIDEFQNINNSNGTYYKTILKYILDHDIKVILSSATPIFDNERELVSMLRLLRRPMDEEPCVVCGGVVCKHKLKDVDVDGLVHYYPGHDKSEYPSSTIEIEVCKMSKYQSKKYIDKVMIEADELKEFSDGFFIQSRQKANNTYKHAWKPSNLHLLSKYSCKLYRLSKYLRPKYAHTFIYSAFANRSGVQGVVELLEAKGYLNFNKHGPGKKRFAVWDGGSSEKQRQNIRETFNSEANDGCGLIQIIVGSPAIKEGVSLLRVRHAHVLETHWNHSRLQQIFGRCVRYHSHDRLPKSERQVIIHLYVAVTNDSGVNKDNFNSVRVDPSHFSVKRSVDLYALRRADEKLDLNNAILSHLSKGTRSQLGYDT